MDTPPDDSHPRSNAAEMLRSVVTPSSWIIGICIVHFDLEYGQMIESTLPTDIVLSKAEATNICFLSFPDSNSHEEGDVSFTFRIRMGKRADALHQKYLIGFVLFRQARDPTIHRGFLQKSVVLLTERPYYSLFRSVVTMLGEAYFTHGLSALEVAYAGITSEWGIPRAGRTYSLPLLGSVLQFRIPFSRCPHMVDGEDAPSTFPGGDAAHPITIANSDGIDLYSLFRSQLSELWRLWEIALTCEPLLVHCAESPQTCGATVLAVVSLISPLKMYGDFRPYFTIHDSEFKEYSDPSNVPPVILGTTNPFFLKALDHWPNVLFIGASKSQRKIPSSSKGLSTNRRLGGKVSCQSDAGVCKCVCSMRFFVSIHSILLLLFLFFALFEGHWSFFLKFGSDVCLLFQGPSNHKLETKEKAILIPDKSMLRGLQSLASNRTHHERGGGSLGSDVPAAAGLQAARNGKAMGPEIRSGTWEDSGPRLPDGESRTVGRGEASRFAAVAKRDRVASDPRIGRDGADLRPKRHGDAKTGGISSSSALLKEERARTTEKNVGRAVSAVASPNPSPNRTLRRYFRDLTERFLIPLESYVVTLMPLERDVSPFNTCPRMRAFKANDFLVVVKQQRPLFTGKAARDLSLYRRFLASPNFKGWLRIRQQRIKKHLAALYLEKMLLLEVSDVGKTKADFEVIDLYLRIKSLLCEVPRESPLYVKLQDKSRAVLFCLQDELRLSIERNELASANLSQTRTEQSGSM